MKTFCTVLNPKKKIVNIIYINKIIHKILDVIMCLPAARLTPKCFQIIINFWFSAVVVQCFAHPTIVVRSRFVITMLLRHFKILLPFKICLKFLSIFRQVEYVLGQVFWTGKMFHIYIRKRR